MATKDVRRSADVDEVKVRDGRVVTVHRPREGGDGARTVVFCHPAPGSGAFDPDPAATAERGVTLIGVDRPGYGGSTPVHDSWATVASAADDIADVLDSLGVGPVGLAGWSAGGRVALALAARRPELVDRVAVVATPAPDEEVSWIPPNEKQMVEAFKGQPPAAVHEQMARAFASMLPQDPIDALPMVGATEQDEATLAAPGTRDRVAGMLATALQQGAAGIVADIASYTLRPWGFEPPDVAAKTLLLYGGRDPIGGEHGRWWRQRLPDARLELVPDAGHLLVIPVWGRVMSHLAPKR
jgi:pimeloyl-ACP methyl ester carboxylesterase